MLKAAQDAYGHMIRKYYDSESPSYTAVIEGSA